jgi:diguanylate cyclase (GGDEF)-like protein
MNNFPIRFFGLKKFSVVPLLAWTLLVSVSLLWNLFSLKQNTLNSFKYEAQTLAGVALSTIMWTVQHEKVYVPLSEWIPPEPFFANLPDREIVTTDGLRFAQISHALISRQIAEHALFQGMDQKIIRMTSLQPLNPANTPDEEDLIALKSLLKDEQEEQTEKLTLIGEGPDATLEYMMPLKAKAECLRCHFDYRTGDLIGGLSITEPAASRVAMIKPQIVSIVATHTGIFVTIAAAMLYLLAYLKRQWFNLDQLNNEQRKMIAKLAESEAKLKEMAVTDELTGLKNRRGFFLLAQQQLKEADRQKEKVNFIFVDVDGMKIVNDKYGHSEGDKSLIATANILKITLRESDIIARIGGDEFVAIMTNTDELCAGTILGRLQENLHLHNAVAHKDYTLSFSAGVVIYNPENPCDIEELLIRADELMYENKRGKRLYHPGKTLK